MKTLRYILLIVLAIGLSDYSFAQQTPTKKNRKVVQFSGVVVTGDSLYPVPFVYVLVKNSRRGTVADGYGFFSFASLENDTIIFTAIGYKPGFFVIPDTLKDNKYSLLHVLNRDTISIKEVVVYPYPTKEQFKQAFVKLNIKDDELELARKNLHAMLGSNSYKFKESAGGYDAAYNNYINNRNSFIFNKGIMPGIPITAFAKFITALDNGDLKIQNPKDDSNYYGK